MRELLITAGLIATLAAASAAARVPWRVLFDAGILAIALGAAVGLPSTVIYHVRLFKALQAVSDAPPGWIWRPVVRNHRVRPCDRAAVMAWCIAGGAGLFIIALGSVLLILGISAGAAQLH